MLLPAFSAILLELFFFEGSVLYTLRQEKDRVCWFFYFFLGYTALYVIAGTLALLSDALLMPAAVGTQIVTLIGLLVLGGVRLLSSRESFARARLAGGKFKYWLVFGVGFVLFYGTQVALNAVLGLGEAVDVSAMMQQVLPPETLEAMTPVTFLVLTGAQSVLFAPLVALLIAFGEEYGWRGYLQDALIKLGRVRGIALLGVIWGLWHAPIIAMGHNYPGYPLLGILLMTIYCVGLSFVLGYVVFKSGSVLLAAYLHALNNQVLSFLYMMVNMPRNPILSFGAGVYGLLSLTVVVVLLLRDPVWRAPLKATGDNERHDPRATQAAQSVNPTPDGTAWGG
jgi:uncharacterized protein